MLERRIIVTRQLVAIVVCCLFVAAGLPSAQAQSEKPAAGLWGDQGDGTYVNPILPADYSDIDAIRVGDDFYAISSTFQFSPGVVVLHSRDLVNWTILGHAVDDLTRIGPEMNWDKMARYGRGIWAGAIRHHDGKFWIYFGTPDEGFFMTTAENPAGPWEPLHPLWKVKGWDDCCPFWDDDGQGYFVCTNFSGGYKIHLFKMTPDGKQLIPESDRVIHQSRGSEANKLFKADGQYYHFYSEVHGEGRVTMMNRSRSLDGPWETKQLNHVDKRVDREPNQGGLIQLASGDWWFVSHQGTGGSFEGRTMVLLPVAWVDSWPIIGKVGADGIGNMIWKSKKPISGQSSEKSQPIEKLQSSDEFDGEKLAPQWEWNYQPRGEKWSLTERPGFLRLHAFQPLKANDLTKAGNTITQRSLRTSANEVTIKLELSGMADGEEAGLCHFAKSNSTLGVSQIGDVRILKFTHAGKATEGPAISVPAIWLRSTWGLDGSSQYFYSTDGGRFAQFGDRYQLDWGNYRGDRVGVFNFNNRADAGFVDLDWFHYSFAGPGGK